jgi:hypothetical protein
MANKPADWKGRDAGGIISERQSRHHWSQQGELHIRLAELKVLLEWCDDMLAAVAAPHRQLPPWSADEYRQVRMAQLQEAARGPVGLSADRLPPDLDEAVRVALLGPDLLDAVLGYTDLEGAWVGGLAGLTPPERDAINYWLTPNEAGEVRSAEEVRDLMDQRRKRFGMPMAIETVEAYLSRGRSKIRRLSNVIRSDDRRP